MAEIISQIKALCDAIDMIWPQVLSSEKGYFGGWVILSQSYCYGYHGHDCNICLKLFSIKHYLGTILAKV